MSLWSADAAPDRFGLSAAQVSAYGEAMGEALELARGALATGDVPIGAVLLAADGAVIGWGANAREATGDPTAHAELLALRQAGVAQESWRLVGCTLVVTLEPCAMCAAAAVAARVERIVLGAWDAKAGGCGSVRDLARDPRANHQVDVVGGVRADECATLLKDFFASRRVR